MMKLYGWDKEMKNIYSVTISIGGGGNRMSSTNQNLYTPIINTFFCITIDESNYLFFDKIVNKIIITG